MEEPSLEALMQAGLISVVCAAIILSNLFIVAAYLMYRGKLLLYVLNIMFMMLTLAVPSVTERACSQRSSASVPFVRSPYVNYVY